MEYLKLRSKIARKCELCGELNNIIYASDEQLICEDCYDELAGKAEMENELLNEK